MCGVKLVDNKKTVVLMDKLGLKEAANKLSRVNGMNWYGHVLRQSEKDVMMKAMIHEMDGKHKQS